MRCDARNLTTALLLAALLLPGLPACDDDDDPTLPRMGPPRSLGLYFDRLARQTTRAVQVDETFQLYVYAFDVTGDLERTLFSISEIHDADTFEVLETVVYPAGIGWDDFEPLDGEYDLHHGSCLTASGTAALLLELTVRLKQPVQDLALQLFPSAVLPIAT